MTGAGNHGKPNHQQQLESLLKEVRELIELLKAERQVKKAPEAK